MKYPLILFVTIVTTTGARLRENKSIPSEHSSHPTRNKLETNNAEAAPHKVIRHIYVHTAPEDRIKKDTQKIRIRSKKEKHVTIIFVKAPSFDDEEETEILLPSPPKRNVRVYILLKNYDVASNVSIKRPPPTAPAKPDVYFIRYKSKAADKKNESDKRDSMNTNTDAVKSNIPSYSLNLRPSQQSPALFYEVAM